MFVGGGEEMRGNEHIKSCQVGDARERPLEHPLDAHGERPWKSRMKRRGSALGASL